MNVVRARAKTYLGKVGRGACKHCGAKTRLTFEGGQSEGVDLFANAESIFFPVMRWVEETEPEIRMGSSDGGHRRAQRRRRPLTNGFIDSPYQLGGAWNWKRLTELFRHYERAMAELRAE